MENLSAKVYECNLAVEAHMVCDLLSQAGISARVDGEFMQGIAGEVPLGNTVKVRVAPERAAEAREVIADWEKLQPTEPTPALRTGSSRWRSPLRFLAGLAVGAVALLVATRASGTPYSQYDRNGDGRTDGRWISGDRYEEDNDFDGRFEWRFDTEDSGAFRRALLDADFDGRPEQVWHYSNSILASIDYFFGARIVKREFFAGGVRHAAEYDEDGDGHFERRVQYDAHGEPRL